MTTLESAARGLRLLSWAAAIMIVRFVIDPVVVALSLGDADLADLGRTVGWFARLHLLDLVVLALLGAGVAANLGELARRRLPRTAALVALAAVVIAGLVQLWMYRMATELAAYLGDARPLADDLAGLLDRLREVPLWALVGTVAYVTCLFAAVLRERETLDESTGSPRTFGSAGAVAVSRGGLRLWLSS